MKNDKKIFCTLVRSKNVHNKIQTSQIHFAVDKNYSEILSRSKNYSTHKNHIGFAEVFQIIYGLLNFQSLKEISQNIEISTKAIKRFLFKYSKGIYLGKGDRKTCDCCDAKIKKVRYLDLDEFMINVANFDKSKRIAYSKKKIEQYQDFRNFWTELFDDYTQNRNNKDLAKRTPKLSANEILRRFEEKYPNSYKPSKSMVYNLISQRVFKDLEIGILVNLSTKGIKQKRPPKRDSRKLKKIGVSIDQRSTEINERLRDNDYELDTVIGSKTDQCCFVTLINRKTRRFYFHMVRRTSTGVRDGLIYLMQKYNLTIDSLTIDNGSENAKLDEVPGIKQIYKCHPYCSGEKGSIENCHRLLRRYFKKGKSIDPYYGQDLTPVMDFINNYKRSIRF
ncbi:IS30 family transposase [Mycoplasmopsis adleri]|uniref:IS30 family transposase n=1 Tax=Mycoplasmopsis adleri TaxID=51362 RepID=UPI00387360F1